MTWWQWTGTLAAGWVAGMVTFIIVLAAAREHETRARERAAADRARLRVVRSGR